MKNLIKAGIYVVLAVSIVIQILGVLYFFNGSLEMFPTDEAHEKARFAALLLVCSPIIIEFIGWRILKKLHT